MSDERHDRGVDVELLADEIDALRKAAHHYCDAVVIGNGVASAGISLETAALHYVRKLDEELEKARRPNYLAIVQQAEKERGTPDN